MRSPGGVRSPGASPSEEKGSLGGVLSLIGGHYKVLLCRIFASFPPSSPKATNPRRSTSWSAASEAGERDQVLLGVTGSGKTFSIAKTIEKVNRPTLVLSHNKTLAAQLFQEFRAFFPHNAARRPGVRRTAGND